jgi:hypothetical protein
MRRSQGVAGYSSHHGALSHDRSAEAMAWVCEQGVVLQSARGPVPNVAQFIAGEPIRGSWWGHPAAKEIYEVLNGLDDAPDVVTTRLANGKITLIHARVWPAIVRVADALGAERLAAVHQEHTASGAHHTVEVAYPLWVPRDALVRAEQLSLDDAFALLPACLGDER